MKPYISLNWPSSYFMYINYLPRDPIKAGSNVEIFVVLLKGSFDAVCFKRHNRTSSTISARSHHSISSCAEEEEEVCYTLI